MTAEGYPGSWCDIHLDRIARNIDRALQLVPKGRHFCAVLKADAYGHGIAQVATLIRSKGIARVGITSNAEARAVRSAGFEGHLIRLRAATPEEIEAALPDRIEEQVASLEVAQTLHDLPGAPSAHLALNAMGMSRDGLEISTREGRETCRSILDLLGRKIGAICTHFPSNHPDDLRRSARRFQKEASWILEMSHRRREEVMIHAGSSLTLVSGVDVDTDMYRCGAILYGILRPDLGFETTMELKARIVSVGTYPAGSTVGYDRDCALETNRRLACLAIGYANGFHRDTAERVAVKIGGKPVPVLGKISMNTLVADVTGQPDVRIGDEATVFGGSDPSVPATEGDFGTIMADLYSDWGQRNRRSYR